jgi:hypothetical protein
VDHRHHVAGGQLAEHSVKLAPVGPRARHFLPVDVDPNVGYLI